MVKVITIRDDVYASLYKIKHAKDMSFSEVLEFLVSREHERSGSNNNMLALSGSVTRSEIDRRLLDKLRRGF